MNKAPAFIAAFAATAAATVAVADTVTLAPPSGTTTNVLTLYTGDTAVEVAGPGTVTLNNANSHTGGTTLSGGTLAISGNIPGGSHSPVGAGTFTVSGGTLRGSGTFAGDITGTGAFSIEAPDGWTLTGENTFAEAVTLSDGALGIADGTSTFSLQLFLGTQGGTGEDVSLTMSGGTVTMGEKNLFLSPGSRTKSTLTMTGGAWNMNNHRILAGYQTTYATNVTDISGTAVITNSEYCYTYAGAGNSWSLNVHDGGLFATKGSLYANGGGAVIDISASNGGEIRANRITSTSGSTTTASVTDGGVIGISDIQAKGTTALSIDGGVVRNDSAFSEGDYFQFFQANVDGLTIAVGPKGATFRGGGKTAKYAQLYKDMSAIPAEAGETAQGVTFDGGNWAYYTTQSYEGPTVIRNGASLFLSGAGELPADSDVTVGSGSQFRIGNTDKSVASLTLEEGATLGFGSKTDTPPKKIVVSTAVTLPSSAKIALYNANTPVTTASNIAGTYTVLQVPAAYADALRAVKWSCATAASGNIYSFAVATSGDTATLSMSIADDPNAGANSITGTTTLNANDYAVSSDITINNSGTLVAKKNIYGSATGGSITINDGGTLDASAGNICPVNASGNSFHLYLNEGGTLIANQIDGSDNATLSGEANATPMFHFNGGTIYPVAFDAAGDANRFLIDHQTALVGENGMMVDLSLWTRPEGYTRWVRSSIQGNVNHDPNCAGADGGITVRGVKGDRAVVYIGNRFNGSTLTGGIRAEDGATVAIGGNALIGQTISLAPGSRLRPYNNTSTIQIGNLTLGETGATEPVLFDGSDSRANYNVVVSNALQVLSPVMFSVCGGWDDDSSPASGVYTALVYRASNSIDTSLFTLPTGCAGTLSASEVTLSGGDYDGWKALVVAIDNDIVVTGSASYPTPKTVSSDVSCESIVVGGVWNGEADPCNDTSLTISGNVTASEPFFLGYNPAGSGSSGNAGYDPPHQGFFTLDGGTVSVPEIYSIYRPNKAGNNDSNCRFGCEATVNGGVLDVAGDVLFGYNRSKYGDKLYSRLTVNGGRVAVGGRFYLLYCDTSSAYSAPGSIVLNDGEVDVTGLIDLSRNAQRNNCAAYDELTGIWLNGGVLKAENIMMTANAVSPKVFFNGGVYAPYGADAANRTMENLNVCYVSTNGAVISTENIPAGETYTIAQALLTDPALSGAADGGLTKKGAGMLALSGDNTFTGPTKVEEGVLVASVNALSDDVAVADGATLDFGGAEASIPRVAASGAVVGNLTVTDAIVLENGSGLLSVDGNLAFGSHAAIDFDLGAGEEPANGWTPVAAVSGEITLPATLRARNAGDKARCETAIVGGVLYVKPTSAGFTIVIR